MVRFALVQKTSSLVNSIWKVAENCLVSKSRILPGSYHVSVFSPDVSIQQDGVVSTERMPFQWSFPTNNVAYSFPIHTTRNSMDHFKKPVDWDQTVRLSPFPISWIQRESQQVKRSGCGTEKIISTPLKVIIKAQHAETFEPTSKPLHKHRTYVETIA